MTGWRRFQIACYVVGGGLIAYGFVELFTADRGPSPYAWLRLWLGGLVLHDFMLAPVVIAIGVVIARVVPASARPYVQAGLIVSGIVTLVALPFVLGYGRTPDEPSALPLNYARGLLVVLAIVWAVVAAAALIRSRRRATSLTPEEASRTRER